MSGKKSLDQIWERMQRERALEEQRRFERERQIWEQKELARREYLKTMRMYEKVGPTVPTSAASAAGGRRIQTPGPVDFPELIQQSISIIWVDVESDTWKLVIYNYDTGVLSDIFDTGLIYDSGNEWLLDRNDYTVHNKGFTTVYQNGITSKYKIFFHNPDGTLVGEKDLDNSEDFQYTENAIIYLGELDGVSTCYHYDGANVRTHTFPNVDISLVEVDDSSLEDVTQDGTILIEAPNNLTYYLARPNGDLVDVSAYLGTVGTGGFYMDYSMDFIVKLNSDLSAFKVISQTGVLEAEHDLSGYNISVNLGASPYGQNSFFLNCSTDYGELFLTYDGDSKQFVALTFSELISGTTLFSRTEDSYYSPKPGAGNHISVAHYNSSSSDSLGYICENLNLWWLPKGSTEFQNFDFTSIGTVSFIDGFGDFAEERTFTKGQNPIIMYSTGAPDDIIVGFMTPTGLATQSTGVKYASCSNIWGSYTGEHSFAVFDVDGDRIWQIYGESSIIEETNTGTNWSWGGSLEVVNRLGTLAVLDSGDPEKSFVWTKEVGLSAGPTGQGGIYNQNQFAIRDFLSYPEQIITQFKTGFESEQFVDGFHLVKLSGLTSKVMFPWNESYSYTINRADVGKDIIYFEVIDFDTSIIRVLVYKKSDLSLIYDYISNKDTSVTEIWDNRVYIVEVDGTNLSFILVGHMGVQELEINATTWQWETNDAEDNDV